jgi:hypothetical protein
MVWSTSDTYLADPLGASGVKQLEKDISGFQRSEGRARVPEKDVDEPYVASGDSCGGSGLGMVDPSADSPGLPNRYVKRLEGTSGARPEVMNGVALTSPLGTDEGAASARGEVQSSV